MMEKKNEKNSYSIGECLLVLVISAIPFMGAFWGWTMGYEGGVRRGESNILDGLEELGMSAYLGSKLRYPELYGTLSKEELCDAFCGKSDFPKEEDAEIGET